MPKKPTSPAETPKSANPAPKPARKRASASALANATAAAPPAKAESVDAARARMHLRSRFNPISNLSPEYLVQTLNAYERGTLREATLLWEAMETRDDTLRIDAPKRKKGIARFGWEIVALEKSRAAARQKQAAEFFFANLRSRHAIKRALTRGWSGLVPQMLDAVGKGYAVHEIEWLPSPQGLTAELTFVPLWFFEGLTGDLRFLPSDAAYEGVELQRRETNWMVTADENYLMGACSIAYLFKAAALRDLALYSEKFSVPGLLAKTNAVKNSAEWDAMVEMVANFANDWAGVCSTDGEIQVIDAAKASQSLPQSGLIDRSAKVMTAMWRGADMASTRSDKTHQYGASLQIGETALLLQDDALLVEDTINIQLLPNVIRFSTGDPQPLVEFRINLPKDADEKEIAKDRFLIEMGCPVSKSDLLERYGRPTPDEGEELVEEPKPPAPPQQTPSVNDLPPKDAPEEMLANAILSDEWDAYVGNAIGDLSLAWREDNFQIAGMLQNALRALTDGDDAAANAILAELRDHTRSAYALQSPASERALEQILAGAFANGSAELSLN